MPEHLTTITRATSDVTHRATRIRRWREMKHRFAVEGGIRTQGLRAEGLARAAECLALAARRCESGEVPIGSIRGHLRNALAEAAEHLREVRRG